MTSTVLTSTLLGSDSRLIYIESDMSNSLPGIVIVGLGDKAISEAKERIRSAIKNSKLDNPKKRITINLSPADIPKDGSHYDLGMALGILQLSGQLPEDCLKDTLILGELGLDGTVRPVRGVIGHIICAQKSGIKRVILPMLNMSEARLVDEVELIPVRSLREIAEHLRGSGALPRSSTFSPQLPKPIYRIDFSDVAGQPLAKRALEIAAAGGHNILMSGPPGGGKTMLARTLPTILPKLTKKQMIETTHLHSISTSGVSRVINYPPFRSPHHSASHISLVGGGTNPMPGEVSLAHNGVLFLDEIPEFTRQSLEALRQPLEDGFITVSRASITVQFPARAMLVATRNPCPCGNYGSNAKQCECSQQQIDMYQKRLSGPMLDRIDIFTTVEPTSHTNLLSNSQNQETSSKIRERVTAARDKQIDRQTCSNASLDSKGVKNYARFAPDTKAFLDTAAEKLHLTSRGYMKTVKVARTIADLADSQAIEKPHIAEALQFREA